jgi:fructoselysine 6-kinase
MSETRKPLVACVGDNMVSRYDGSGHEAIAGSAVNVAVRLSHAGMESAYVGVVGDDDAGRQIVAGLEAEGVDVSLVAVADGTTGSSEVRWADGVRQPVDTDPGVAASLRLNGAHMPFLLERTWVHCARLNIADAPALALLAREGVSMSYDFGADWTDDEVAAFAPHLEAAFFDGRDASQEEARWLVQRVVACGARCALLTNGGEGVIAWAEGRFVQRTARQVAVIDALGARDAFVAGFIVATLAGAAADEAIDRGTHEAVEACSHRGAWRPRGARILD